MVGRSEDDLHLTRGDSTRSHPMLGVSKPYNRNVMNMVLPLEQCSNPLVVDDYRDCDSP